MNIAGANEAPSCHGGLENLDEEHNYWIDEIEGEVPRDLVSIQQGMRNTHPWDKDANICHVPELNLA